MNEKDVNVDALAHVVEYIHQSIKFNSKVDNVSYQTSMDNTFDWIVEKVSEEREKEWLRDNNMYEDITLTERFKKFTSKVSRVELGYRDVSIDELRLELFSLDEKLENFTPNEDA